jgi:peptide/nickel transport system substrate-binding protein
VTLNAQINGQAKARVVVRNLFDSLLARTDQGEYVPWLATGYEISDEGRSFIFTLRDGVRFTDGLPLDAEAVALNFRKVQNAAYAKNLGGGPITRLKEAKALDSRRVKLTLSEMYSHFLGIAAGLEILSPAAFDSKELNAGGKSIAGSGPFVLAEYVRGQEVRFVRNPDYKWGPANAPQTGTAYLDEVVYRFLPESSVRIGALTSGQVDIIEGISGNDAGIFRDDDSYTYQRGYNTGTPYSLFFNVEYGPTRDVKVRKAIGASVDLDAVLQSVYRGERTRAWGINSPIEAQVYDPAIEKKYGFDAALANRLLDEAGWTGRDAEGIRTKGDERLSIHLVQAQATVRDQRDVLLQALQAQAKQNAGIDLAIEYVDAGTYTERRNSGKYGIIANSNAQIDGLDLEYKYLPIDDGGAHGFSRATNPELKQWLRQASSTLDAEKRSEIYSKLQDFILLKEALAFPLYVPDDQVAAAAEVKGVRFRSHAQMPENSYGIWLDR